MIMQDKVFGKRLLLRTAVEEDADFILSLRLDPRLNRYIHKTDPSVEKQRQYIRAKQQQEADYHMVVETLDGKRVGIVAVYDINFKKKTFVWGRWIIDPAMPGYAIEMAILVYYFAFNILKLEVSLMDVHKDNEKVIAIHKKLGAEVTGCDDDNVYFRFPKDNFKTLLEKYSDRHCFNY